MPVEELIMVRNYFYHHYMHTGNKDMVADSGVVPEKEIRAKILVIP